MKPEQPEPGAPGRSLADRWRRRARTGSWVVADQAVVSGSNFLAVVLLARMLGPEEFGIYAWAIIGLQLLSEIPAAVILAPHNVIGARLVDRAYAIHTSTMAVLQLAISLGTAVLLAIAAAVVQALFSGGGEVLLALAALAISWQAREFVRRVLQTAGRWSGALISAAIGGGSQVAVILLLHAGGALNATVALWILVMASTLAAIAGLLQVRYGIVRSFRVADVREAWMMGRWLLGSSAVSQVGRYVNGMILPIVAGPGSFGLYRAVSQLVGLIDLPIKALGNFLRPSLSRRSMQGVPPVRAVVHPLLASGGTALFLAAIIAGLFGRDILRAVYGDEYVVIANLVFFVALYPLFTFGRIVLDSAIIALDPSPRAVLYAATAGSLGAVVVGPVSILAFGVNGAPASVITAGAITFGVLWSAWRATMRRAAPRHGKGTAPPTGRASNLAAEEDRS